MPGSVMKYRGCDGLGLELAADLGHEDPQVVGLVVVLRPPHLLEELALGDEPARVAHEHLDEVPLGGREPDLLAVARDALGREVDGEVGRLDDRRLLGGRGATQRGPQAGQRARPSRTAW